MLNYFWFTFKVDLCRQFFAISVKKVLDQNGPYNIDTFPQKKLRNVCLLVILSVVVCIFAPAYNSLCRGQAYLLKIRYIILVNPNGDFWFSKPFFWVGRKNVKMSDVTLTININSTLFGPIMVHYVEHISMIDLPAIEHLFLLN